MPCGDNAFAVVERAIRKHTFGTLATLTRHGGPHATAVVYAVAPPSQPLTLYVTTRTTTLKVTNPRPSECGVRHPRAASPHPDVPPWCGPIPGHRNNSGCR